MFNRKAWMKEYLKSWRLAHPNYEKEYYAAHREQEKKDAKKWNLAHPEQRKVANKKNRLAHPEKEKARHRKIYLIHREDVKTKQKQYRQTPKGKEVERRHSAARKGFGFVPLNKFSDGVVSHHIDEARVIYVPAEMHEGTKHSVLQNRNMDEMNYHAFNHLEAEELYAFAR